MNRHERSSQTAPTFLGEGLDHPGVDILGITWNGHWVVSPGNPTSLELGREPLIEVLSNFYRGLSLLDTCLLWKNINQSGIHSISRIDFFKDFDHALNSRTEKLPEILLSQPESFLKWFSKRKLSLGDLIPLLSLKEDSDISKSLCRLSEFDCSRSEGKRLIDLLVDLTLLGVEVPDDETKEGWVLKIENHRYPQTQKRDQASAHPFENLPKFGNYRGRREGDQWSHSLTIRFKETSEGIEKLERLKEKMENLEL